MSLRAAIDIGTSGVRIVESSVARSITVKKAAAAAIPREFTPPGSAAPERVIKDDGTIVGKEIVADILRRLWRKNRFRARDITVVLSSDFSFIIREATMDYHSNANVMRNVVSSSAQAVLSRDPNTMEIAYHTVGVRDVAESEDSVVQKASIDVVGADREILNSIIDTLQLAGINPTSVDVAPFVLTRFVSGATGKSNFMDFVLHIGASTVSLVGIIDGQYVSSTSMSNHSGSAMTSMLKDFTPSGSWESAEETKVNPRPIAELANDAEAIEARQQIAALADVFVRESAETIISVARQHNVPVRNVWVSGGGARMPGLVGRLGNEETLADADISLLNPQTWVNGADKIEDVINETGQDVTLAVAASGK